MPIAIVDYRAGNLRSVERALTHLGAGVEVTGDPERIRTADRVVFPGVGAAGSCMANLRERGLDRALGDYAASGRPLLCICIGMQLLFERSEEDGGVGCLGLLPGEVVRFRPPRSDLKVPHMGWNQVAIVNDPLFAGIPSGSHFYFVHSYHCAPAPAVPVIASSDHGGRFCAAVRHGSLAAVQFHPEKSGPAGLKLLENFLAA
jgi:imidazole glycerol-phosphate synthase subunit HisH